MKVKRIISLCICIAMFFGIFSNQVFAEDKSVETININNLINENGVATFDCVWFGSYMQSDDKEQINEPIKWRVLSVEGNKALLLADKKFR